MHTNGTVLNPTMNSAFYVESKFFASANNLREQFANHIAAAALANNVASLSYVYRPNTYQFLTANAEQIFPRELLQDFIESLAEWAEGNVRTSHVSTPQARVFINGCSRTLARDDVNAKWHYMFWLSPSRRRHRSCRVKISTERFSPNYSVLVQRLVHVEPEFNNLVVNDTECLYAIDGVKTSMNPSEAFVFLDGYLW